MANIEDNANGFVLSCWEEVAGGREFIYVSQIPQIVEKMEQKLNCKSLLAAPELKLLRDMMTDKPLLKLYRAEFKDFMMKLVANDSWSKFLMDRMGVSQFNLNILLNQPHTNQISPLKPAKLNSPTINTSTPIKNFGIKKESPVKIEPLETKTNLHKWKSNLDLKDKHIDQRDQHISVISKENQELFNTTKTQMSKIKQLESQNKDLQHYIDILETKYDNSSKTSGRNKSDKLIVKDLIRQCSERDETIKSLEQVCSQYQQEFDKLKNNSVIQTLTNNLSKQDKLIQELKTKLQLQQVSTTANGISKNGNEQLEQFIAKIPILKQYYMYYRYREQHKNLGMIFINVLAVFITGGVMMTGLRIMFLLGLQMFNSTSTGHLDYIYDDYGLSNWSNHDTVSFVWWKEIEWIEYLVYKMGNWLQE